jgi:uncharacterized protein
VSVARPAGPTEGRRWHGVTNATLCALFVLVAAADWLVERVLPARATGVAKLAVLGGVVAFGALVMVLSAREMAMDRRDLRAGVRYGALAACVVVLALIVLVAVPSSRAHFLHSRVRHDSTAEHWLLPLLVIPLGTAVYEEVIFRGVLLGAALRRWNTYTSVIVTSVAFGLWHLPVAASDPATSGATGPAPYLATFAFTAAAGVAFAVLRLRSKSVVAPVLAHVATNSGAYVAALVALHVWH